MTNIPNPAPLCCKVEKKSKPDSPLCSFPWTRILVFSDGSFKHCCYMTRPVGNIDDGSFIDVWNNENSQQIRKAILSGQLDKEFCICEQTIGHIPANDDPEPHIRIKEVKSMVRSPDSYVQVNIESPAAEVEVAEVEELRDGLYCNGGSRWFSMGSEGNVYRCNALMYSEDGYIGNIFSENLKVSDKFEYCPIQQCQQICDRHWSQKEIVKNHEIVDRQDVVGRKDYDGKVNPTSILWSPSWKCNYTCKYCYLPTNRQEYKFDQWIEAFGAFLDRNDIGGGILHTNGGEPMFYKGIVDIFKYMLSRNFTISLTTNLSVDMSSFIKSIPTSSTGINASLHVTDKRFDWNTFSGRVLELQEAGYNQLSINFVAHPDYVHLIPEYHDFFTVKHGIEFCVIPMIGGWSGVEFSSIEEYPEHLRSILKKYVIENLQDDNRFTEGDRVTQPSQTSQPQPSMNSIRTAGYSSSTDEINPVMTRELFDFIAERSKIYEPNSDFVSDWLQNRQLAIEERNARKIELSCKPLYLDIELNNMCNLKCKFCACTYGHVRDSSKPEAMLTEAEIDKLSELFKWAEVIETSKAGEPFMVPDLFVYALERIRSSNPFVIIHTVTNGTILTDSLLSSLISNKLDHMYVSISGDTQERYAQIMGGDKFDKVLSNLEKIQIAKQQASSKEPYLHFNTQLTRYCDPIAILELADQYGVIEVNFIKTHKHVNSQGEEAPNFKGKPVQDYMSESEIDALLSSIVKKANELRISVNFPGWPKREDTIIGSSEQFYYPHITKYFDLDLTCPTDAPWFRFCTAMRGVQPCCWSGPFADWTKQSFEEIWNCQHLRHLRVELAAGQYPKVCQCRY